MNNKCRFILLALVIPVLLMLIGCGGSGPSFRVHTQYFVTGIVYDDAYVGTSGFCGDCVLAGYTGPLNWLFYQAQTDNHGFRVFDDAYVPANWEVARYQSARCAVPVIAKDQYVIQGDTVPIACTQQPNWNTTPNAIDATSPPATILFSGDSVIDTSYGMPQIDFYNDTGTTIGTAVASSASVNSVTVSTPAFLPAQYSGSYVAVISNRTASGSLVFAAAAAIDVYGNDPPPPPPPDECTQHVCPFD